MGVDVDAITETLFALEREINARWNKGDVDGALEMYSDDVTYFDPLTERLMEGREQVEAYFRSCFEGKLNIVRNNFSAPRVIVSQSGDLAVLSYNLDNFVAGEDGEENPGSSWNSTQVYRLLNGQWRIAHVNWSFTRHPDAIQGLIMG
jgi:uncharacterized protein (TIGR02246 family)